MALANFFDKTALAAATLLRGFDHANFTAALEAIGVGVGFDRKAAESTEGRLTLELSVNLLARLYPRLALMPLDRRSAGYVATLASVARSINPAIEITGEMSERGVYVIVGSTPIRGKVRAFYVGSNGWIARVSTRAPRGSGGTSLPFGAGGAACFGVANLFRHCFSEQLTGAASDDEMTLSLFDYSRRATGASNPRLQATDIGEVQLVGLGAVGNGAVWALRHTEGLRGVLEPIDNETLDLGNLQRYALAVQGDVERSKVVVAADALADRGLVVRPFKGTWGAFLKSRTDWRFRRVLTAVDNAATRIAVQAALPHWIANAWTQAGDLGVSRHSFIGEYACLACLYLPEGTIKNEDELIAEAIGLPAEKLRVRALLHAGEAVGRDFLAQIAAALGIGVDEILRFETQPLRTFYREALCGGLILRLKGGPTTPGVTEVPMAFQSALAGIMLAAELVADAAGRNPMPPPVTTRINVLKPLATFLSTAEKKRSEKRCLCQDADYIDRYRAKYGAAAEITSVGIDQAPTKKSKGGQPSV